MDSSIELIEDRAVATERLKKIKTGLSFLAEKHSPVAAYEILLDAFIGGFTRTAGSLFYFPIPWDKASKLPSHPSLVADARHYCQSNGTDNARSLIVNSFAGWQTFWNQKRFCSCVKSEINSEKKQAWRKFLPSIQIAGPRERYVDIEIVVHHPVKVDCESGILEIKQLVGIKSGDRNHIENHYKLRRESRVDKNISIVRTEFLKIGLPNFGLIKAGEECSQQFDADIFKKAFTEICLNASKGPA